ncbi:signal transduction histidine kinase [Chryseobacterium sp. 2987]|nr:signal transduction histidine kinase [Chryseobacterium sp. 2987]
MILYIYFFIFFCCVVFSLAQKIKGINNDYLYIYLTLIFLIDFSVLLFAKFFKTDITGIYFFSDLTTILFTYLYFVLQFSKERKILVLTVLCLVFLFLNIANWSKKNYEDSWGLISCFYTIFVCLFGFYKIIESSSSSDKKIQDLPFFWYGTAMLLWCVIFLLRIVPRFYFQNTDKLFMDGVRNFFGVINIITYCLFFYLLLKYNKNKRNVVF